MSKKTLRVHWSGEEDKSESTDGGQSVQNGILKNTMVNTRKEVIPEQKLPYGYQINKKRVQNFVNPQDPKRQKQDFQNIKRVRQKQRAPLPPNVGRWTINNAHVSASCARQVSSAGVPQQYLYPQQAGGSTRRYPPGYRSSQPQSAYNPVRSSRTLPPYRIVPPQLELLRMDNNSPQVRLGRYRPKVIQDHFSPNNVRDTEFLNKRREKPTPDKRKSEQTYTWERQRSHEAKVTLEANTSTLRTKTIVRLKAPPSQPSVSEGRPKSTHVSSVTVPPRSPATNNQNGDNGNFVIVDYLVDNLGPQMLQMKLTENGDSNLNNGPTNGLRLDNNEHTSVTTSQSINSDSGVEMIEVQKQILQQRQSEVSLAQLPVS